MRDFTLAITFGLVIGGAVGFAAGGYMVTSFENAGVKADTIASAIGGVLGAAVTVALIFGIEQFKRRQSLLPHAHTLAAFAADVMVTSRGIEHACAGADEDFKKLIMEFYLNKANSLIEVGNDHLRNSCLQLPYTVMDMNLLLSSLGDFKAMCRTNIDTNLIENVQSAAIALMRQVKEYS